MVESHSLAVLAIAFLLDALIGDPWNWLHPVQIIGWWIKQFTLFVFDFFSRPLVLKLAGVVLGLWTILGTGLVAWGVVFLAYQLHPLFGIVTESVIVASCLAERSLRDAAHDVLTPLQAGKLESARQKMAQYVGRDTTDLDKDELHRAILETITENATDGVLAPLFYAILGTLFPAGSATLALAYKAASTLDSMVGYKTPPYTDLGWFSARLEDILTWIPCRLVVGTIALLSGTPRRVWAICRRDAPNDPSPNAGWSECAYAAALGVQVGGTNYYDGVKKHKPLLGDRLSPITTHHIYRALRLTRWSMVSWLGITMLILLLGI